MELIEGIRTRRSIRRFTEQAVPAETLERIVATAAYAPSWKNTQTARYIAVTDAALRRKIAEDCVLGYAGNHAIITGAPVLIVLAAVDGRSGYERDGSFATAKGTHWQSFDAGIAAQTFCLAAHNEGLGTVIMGIFDGAKVAEAVRLPEGQSVSALIALGYPAVDPAAPPRKDADTLLSYR